jgi:hypothetical protein
MLVHLSEIGFLSKFEALVFIFMSSHFIRYLPPSPRLTADVTDDACYTPYRAYHSSGLGALMGQDAGALKLRRPLMQPDPPVHPWL